VPSARTEITEIVTGLAMLGYDSVEDAVRARPAEVTNVSAEQWDRLAESLADRRERFTFEAAWANGRAFARARDGLRGREPIVVEWKGPHRSVGDEAAPVDLRVDHVYLVSCKYLSRILHNLAPARLFEQCITGPRARSYGDWYLATAPRQYQELYAHTRAALGDPIELPRHVADLGPPHRRLLKDALRRDPVTGSDAIYAALAAEVSAVSAELWRAALETPNVCLAMLWRLLRIGSAPYFILGTGRRESIRLRIATPWDWQQQYSLRRFETWAEPAGQPLVRWRAEVDHRAGDGTATIDGHVEIRWSHGRFSQPPEAKVYLDTSHRHVPGYIALV
jgi:hypothetical protein